jgi:hypothetical protein
MGLLLWFSKRLRHTQIAPIYLVICRIFLSPPMEPVDLTCSACMLYRDHFDPIAQGILIGNILIDRNCEKQS